VEIQVRTIYQDGWAQLMEAWGDAWGRAIRYGGDPELPDLEEFPGMTRREVVREWIKGGDALHEMADVENDLARMRRGPMTEDLRVRVAALEARIEAGLGPLRRAIVALSSVNDPRD
jgi:hypothetical protein